MKKILLLVLGCLFLVTLFGCSPKSEEAYYYITNDYNEFFYYDSPFMKKVIVEGDSISSKVSSYYFVVEEDTIKITKEEEENAAGQHWTVFKGADGSELFYPTFIDGALNLIDVRGKQGSLSGYYKQGQSKDSLGHTVSSVIKDVENYLKNDALKELDSKAYEFCDKSEYETTYIEEDGYWYLEGYIIVDESKLYEKSSWESPNGKFNDEFRILLRYSNNKDYEVLYFNMN